MYWVFGNTFACVRVCVVQLCLVIFIQNRLSISGSNFLFLNTAILIHCSRLMFCMLFLCIKRTSFYFIEIWVYNIVYIQGIQYDNLIYIYCETYATINFSWHIFFGAMVRTFKIYFHDNLQVHITVLLTIVTTLYITAKILFTL